MAALLESPAVRDQVHHISVGDYHRMAEAGILSKEVELLRGIIVKKMSKSPRHEFVAHKLMLLLLRKAPKSFQVRRESPLTLRDSEPEPDLSVISGQPEDWLKAHPSTAHLVVEIALTSLEIDTQKAQIYAEAGIPEFWLVRPEARLIEVHTKPTANGYVAKQIISEEKSLRCASIPQIEISLQEIFPASA